MNDIIDPRCGKFGSDREIMLTHLRIALNDVYSQCEKVLEGQ